MNTQITLDHIKAILFRATSLNEALAQLDSLGVSYRGETAYVIDAFGVTFWPARTRLSGNRPLFVMVDSENVRDTTEEHLAVLAQLQGPELVTEVPAATFPVAAEHPEIEAYLKTHLLPVMIRTIHRIKRAQAERYQL